MELWENIIACIYIEPYSYREPFFSAGVEFALWYMDGKVSGLSFFDQWFICSFKHHFILRNYISSLWNGCQRHGSLNLNVFE